jgi:hypothetical protein
MDSSPVAGTTVRVAESAVERAGRRVRTGPWTLCSERQSSELPQAKSRRCHRPSRHPPQFELAFQIRAHQEDPADVRRLHRGQFAPLGEVEELGVRNAIFGLGVLERQQAVSVARWRPGYGRRLESRRMACV